MTKLFRRRLLILITFLMVLFSGQAQGWRENMDLLIYSPRYFGPLAFPMPQLRDGLVSERYEVELSGEYHHYSGDKTMDIVGRATLPFVRGKAGVEVIWYIKEKYKYTDATRDERYAVANESPIAYSGDVIVTAFFQVLRSERYADILVNGSIKTASGGRLVDARFTDAAAYWFDINVARNIWKNKIGTAALRIQAMAGFYCWMTNDMVHRQNDALVYAFGLSGRYRNVSLATDITALHGYENNGDRPIHWRNSLKYDVKNNIVTFRYTHGMKDRLYDSFSLGYARCF